MSEEPTAADETVLSDLHDEGLVLVKFMAAREQPDIGPEPDPEEEEALALHESRRQRMLLRTDAPAREWLDDVYWALPEDQRERWPGGSTFPRFLSYVDQATELQRRVEQLESLIRPPSPW